MDVSTLFLVREMGTDKAIDSTPQMSPSTLKIISVPTQNFKMDSVKGISTRQG